jgi:hypothetical protein
LNGQRKQKGAPKKIITRDVQKVIRFSGDEIIFLNKKMKERGFDKLSPFIRELLLNDL